LYSKGHDIWFLNNRGTRYSRGHTSLDADSEVDASDYWYFYNMEMSKDVVAAVKLIFEEGKLCKKI